MPANTGRSAERAVMDTEDRFVTRKVGTTGHEMLSLEGVVAWAVNADWGTWIVALLNRAVATGLSPRMVVGDSNCEHKKE